MERSLLFALVGCCALTCAPLAAGAATPPAWHTVFDCGEPAQRAHPRVGAVTRVEMRHVSFHIADGIVLGIRHLRGEMCSKRGGPVAIDDKTSFIIQITTAEVGLTGEALSNLMNVHVFAYKGSPLRHLKITTVGRQIRQTGVLRKLVSIPFEITANVQATTDGRIQIHPTKMKIFSVDGDKLIRITSWLNDGE